MTRRLALLPILLLSLLLVLPACQVQDQVEAPIVVTREPVPTPAPGFISEQVEQITEASGLADTSFLGLAIDDWINLGISILIVFIGYLLVTWLLHEGYKALARVTNQELAADVQAGIGNLLRWLALAILLNYAIARLVFLPIYLRTLLLDIVYIAWTVVAAVAVWRMLDLAVDYYRSIQTDPQRLKDIEPALVLIVRVGRIVLVAVAASLLLAHFGINIAAITAVLGIGGLALSLAARDTIADAIAGVIILFDRPFRVGDRIEIQELGTWGDVVDIGLRTTRIRTRDNRLVIVPNATINNNQIVNYTYPDPRYRIETRLGIAYGSDIEHVRQVITEAVRDVEGVLPDRPVDVLYDEMGDSAMMFRVRWWIQSYEDTRRMDDRVNTAIQSALDANGIRSPYPTQTIKLETDNKPPAGSLPSSPAD